MFKIPFQKVFSDVVGPRGLDLGFKRFYFTSSVQVDLKSACSRFCCLFFSLLSSMFYNYFVSPPSFFFELVLQVSIISEGIRLHLVGERINFLLWI